MKLLVSILLSTLIFLFIYESICYIKFEPKKIEVHDKIKKQFINSTFDLSIEKFKQDSICLKKLQSLKNYNIECQKPKVTPHNIEHIQYTSYKLFSRLNKSRVIIKIIFLFLILSLSIQIYIYILSVTHNSLDEKYFHLSELSINASPMLGLLGTFISLSILLGKDANNLSKILINGFFDAVTTTIIGIIFYLISFYLKVYIYPKIKSND